MPVDLNWWIGVIFSIGASLFILGSLLTLFPELQHRLGIHANSIYFSGSIPFTIAAYLQLFQAANTPPLPHQGERERIDTRWIGWRPSDIGWWSCLLQWIGTLLFNVNTFNAMNSSLSWVEQDVWVWIPNIVGSVLFMISGYMAFAETCHGYWKWEPRNTSWWVVALNLAGCIGFLASACFALAVSDQPTPIRSNWSVLFTLQGAFGFLLGSLMMLPEAACKDAEVS